METSAPSRLGRYEFREEVGRGATSIVCRAQDPEIDRSVAVKLFSKERCGTARNREAIFEKVRAAGGLTHPGIVKVFDAGEVDDSGALYLVTEFVEGISLDRLLAQQGKLAPAQALAVTTDLLSALAYAHSNGVVHHNLKPSNVFLMADQHVKVSDFYSGRCGGTVGFVAPERLKGDGDHRSDLFSVGAMLYLMLSGHKPFQGNTDATISFKVVNQNPVPVAALDLDIPTEFDYVIDRLMAKDPGRRYQTAAEALVDLKALGQGEVDQPSWLAQYASRVEAVSATNTGKRPTSRVIAGLSEDKRSWPIAVVAFASVLLCTIVAADKVISILRQAVPAPPVLSVRIPVPYEIIFQSRDTPERTQASSPPLRRGARIPLARSVRLALELRSPFEEYKVTIWVDDRLVYTNSIRREQKKRFLGLGRSTKEYLTLIQVPAGERLLRVRIESASESFDRSGILAATIKAPGGQKLQIICERNQDHLQLSLN